MTEMQNRAGHAVKYISKISNILTVIRQ